MKQSRFIFLGARWLAAGGLMLLLLSGLPVADSANAESAASAPSFAIMPQVHIRARFVEVPEKQAAVLQIRFATTDAGGQTAGVLTASQASTLFKSFEKAKGVTILSTSELVTLSGRQAEIQVLATNYVATDFIAVTSANGAVTNSFPDTPVSIGPALGVIPYVTTNRDSVRMFLMPTITEYLGYNPGMPTNGLGIPLTTLGGIPGPRYRVVQTSSTMAVRDGETLMLGGFKNDVIVWAGYTLVVNGRKHDLVADQSDGITVPEAATDGSKKRLFIFITPTIIDAAGNRINIPADGVPVREY